MKSVRVFGLCLALMSGPALAQAPGQSYGAPPPGYGGGQQAQAGPSCVQLEGALASLDRSTNDPNNGRAAQLARMRSDLDRLNSQAKQMSCDAPRGFFIFQGPPRPPQCDVIDDQISRLRASIASVDRGGGDQDGQRRQLILALAQANCGQQYRAAAQAMGAGQPARQPPRQRNFFEALFGGPVNSEPEEGGPGLDVAPMELPKSSTYRTVCVRTCDGFYFPISYATVPSRFASDDAQCRRLCPATEAQLFSYRNPGEDIQQATSITGKPYMSLPTALMYRKQLVPSCSCRAPGQSWAQALSGLEDASTLQKGDILVTEEQAKEMSQPRPASDPATAGAKGKAAAATPSRPAAAPLDPVPPTSAAPLAPAAEQPGRRPVRVIPAPGGSGSTGQ
ncbi:MAG: hypothetical protein B7Y12_11605 [Rhizobiales bacterium 24-66-13]|uniref:DUF2865 domain-containing protein n=1 Tax=Roseixanthobacter finlandensis TaxID=3119922 RepID=UPI000BCF15D6|nr:MAG: hypothetical protein B7Y12_11605 [Rhizobiales bacterium 24-66-13]OZB04802.1 MAG: hypothetical protein B7X67_13320 [Rhizobiales bacterium 39-66-18]HQS09402.1 DUF2865 domain-containing protein [Xanthobacteraceae bacterium]HQS47984.1 DUF2865 domain-containing protein [Xanthobacteraceae bacterium]